MGKQKSRAYILVLDVTSYNEDVLSSTVVVRLRIGRLE